MTTIRNVDTSSPQRPGSVPALHPQRPLDPDQPALHRPHPLPGPPLMDQFRKSEKLLLTGFNSSN